MADLLNHASLHRVETRDEHWVFSPSQWDGLQKVLLAILGELHQSEPDSLGPDRERLRRIAMPLLPSAIFRRMLDTQLQSGAIQQTGPWLHLPEHKVRLSDHEEQLWMQVQPMLVEHPFQPPRVRDIARMLEADEKEIRLLLNRVTRTGQTYLIAKDHFFTHEAIGELADIIHELANKHDSIAAGSFRDRIGTGRKLAIQILEYFDRIGYTRRICDEHRLREKSRFEGHAT